MFKYPYAFMAFKSMPLQWDPLMLAVDDIEKKWKLKVW